MGGVLGREGALSGMWGAALRMGMCLMRQSACTSGQLSMQNYDPYPPVLPCISYSGPARSRRPGLRSCWLLFRTSDMFRKSSQHSPIRCGRGTCAARFVS
jgi:hypothetical protein